MVSSCATRVEDYLAELDDSRLPLISAVRDLVNRHLPPGYVESMAFGMIGWGIPLSRFAETYNAQPLGYVALAAQKNHNALYLMSVYADSAQERALREGYAARGLRLDLGKCCLRFKQQAPPEDLIGPIIAATSVDDFIEHYQRSRGARR